MFRGSKPRELPMRALENPDDSSDRPSRRLGRLPRGGRASLPPAIVGPDQELRLGNRGVQIGDALNDLHDCLDDDNGGESSLLY